MNEENSTPSPQTPDVPQKNELPILSPENKYNTPLTTRNFPVSNPNLKPLEVNLPKDPVPPQVNTPPTPVAPQQTQPVQTQTATPEPTTANFPPAQPAAEQSQVFVNPNPAPIQTDVSGVPTAGNPFGLNQNLNDGNQPPPEPTQTPQTSGMPKPRFNLGILIITLVIIAILGGGGFALNEFVLNKVTSLSLMSENTQFYLTLAVKKNPQADKAKTTIKKFPGGDTMLKQFDKYYTQFTGTDPKNVLNDLTQYANTELLFARESRAKDKDDTSQRLVNIVDTTSTKEAKDGIANFSDDTATYKVTNDSYKGVTYSDIKLLSEQKLYENQIKNSSNLSYSLSTPKPQSRFATNIDKFIFSSDKEDDVKMAIDLSQAKKFFGLSVGSSPKSVLDSADHQKIANLFPKETFIRYFTRDPITPYSSFFPFFGTSVDTSPYLAETEAKEFQKTTRGVDGYFTEEGLKIDAYSLDNLYSKNSFNINQSLATKLPQKFANVAPTLYFETQNLQSQWKQEVDNATAMKDSKSRSQGEQFSQFLDSVDKMKQSYKTTYGIDYEDDVLSWLDGQVSFLFNAGATNKGPEGLLIAETKNVSKAEDMIKKIRIPQYSTPTYTLDANGQLQVKIPEQVLNSFSKIAYKDTNIYSLALPEYLGFKYSYYFAVTKTKAILAISDSDQSVKDIIDFENKPGTTLAKNSNWQKQFSKLNGSINNIAFAEPSNLMGFLDYVKTAYPQYKQLASSYSPGSSTYVDDIEKAVGGYLKTIPSIGVYSGQNKDVGYSRIFVNIVELPSTEKKDAEDALGRLIQTDNSNQYKSVLGINSETTFDKIKNNWNSFFSTKLKPIIDPQNILQ